MSKNISRKSVTIASFCYAMYNDIDISVVVIVTGCLSVCLAGRHAGTLARTHARTHARMHADRQAKKNRDRETSLLPAHHGFSDHPEHHLFLRLTVEEPKHPLRLLLLYTPCANHLSLGNAVSKHSNTHFHHTYLLCTTTLT